MYIAAHSVYGTHVRARETVFMGNRPRNDDIQLRIRI